MIAFGAFIIGIICGCMGTLVASLKEKSEIEVEEYKSNTGKTGYKFFKKEEVLDPITNRLITQEKYIGEIVDDNNVI